MRKEKLFNWGWVRAFFETDKSEAEHQRREQAKIEAKKETELMKKARAEVRELKISHTKAWMNRSEGKMLKTMNKEYKR